MGLALADGGPARHRHHHPGLGVPQRPGRRPPPGARRQARRLLPAALQPRHRQRADPRDGLGPAAQLWFVNTRFSCLCTLDSESSFVPRWRPPFITELAPADRCHLNGLALVDGQPRYVTALGETNAMAGWRKNKARGGILMDVESGEVLCRACRCRTRRAGTTAGSGSASRARGRSA